MSKTFQFESPNGIITVGAELARVYRKTNGYSEIIPESPEAESPDSSTDQTGDTKSVDTKNRSDR